jgi:ribosomal protein S18 acetylase RimI-like enzyme
MVQKADPHADISFVPVGEVAAETLARLLAAERREWLARLDWDLGEVASLVVGATRDEALRGPVLHVGGRPAGFALFSSDPQRCLVGDFYVLKGARRRETNEALATAVIAAARRARPRARIESQAICFEPEGVDEAFAREGFSRHERLFMTAKASHRAAVARDRFELRAWRDGDFDAVTSLVYAAYRGSVDAALNAQYRTRDGCAVLLDALTSTVWCGHFLPEASVVAVDAATRRVCGVLVASRVSRHAAHFSQISVAPRWQGIGVGEALLRYALAATAKAGLSRATLAVTRENRGALRLYERVGFRSLLDFAVYERDTGTSRRVPAALGA